ncbi:MAG: pilus assembly protein PilM [Candidatus Omnitrophica bacterium]|nr:pilus assembly protein PilM [Candidatus Omnitrophota bacterium]
MNKGISSVIEITESSVKLLQYKGSSGKKVFLSADVKPLVDFNDEELVKSLNGFIVSRSIGSGDLTLIVPRKFAILKQMKLPSHNEAEIKKMIGLQLVSQLPYSLEDVIYDYLLIEKDSSGYSRALVFVLHKDVSQRYINLLEKVGLRPNVLTVSSLGILGWLNYQTEIQSINLHSPVIVVDIDMQHSEICFLNNLQLLFSRNVDWGLRDLNEDNPIELLGQIELSLEAYNKENMGPAVKRVMIISCENTAEGLKKRIEEELKLPVDILYALDNLTFQKSFNLASMKDNRLISLTVALGHALENVKHALNLLPKEIHDSEKIKKQTKKAVKFGFLFLSSLLLCAAIMAVDLYQRRNYLRKIEMKAEDINPKLKDAKNKLQFVKFFNEEYKGQTSVADIIAGLIDITPLDISYRSVYLDENGAFTLQGYAQKGASVNDLQSKMVKSPIFKEVNLQFATKRMTYNMELTDFKIIAQIIKK